MRDGSIIRLTTETQPLISVLTQRHELHVLTMTDRLGIPLLSVCIPSFNRSRHLDALLATLCCEPLIQDQQIEVIISDNCSQDDTEGMLQKWAAKMPIRTNRWSHNIGGSLNILSIPGLASGEFCIILGDDDLFVPGALQSAIAMIKQHPSYDLFAIGYSYQPASRRDEIVDQVLVGGKAPLPGSNYTLGECDGGADQWGEVLSLTDIAANLTAIPSFIFRRNRWIDESTRLVAKITVVESINLSCLEAAFPQSLIWIEMAKSGLVYIDTKAYTYFFIGEQDWFAEKWHAMLLGFCIELAIKMRAANAGEVHVRHYLKLIASDRESFAILFVRNDYTRQVLRPRRTIRELGFSRMAWSHIQSHFYSSLILPRVKYATLLIEIMPAWVAKRENLIAGAPYVVRMIKYSLRLLSRSFLMKLSLGS